MEAGKKKSICSIMNVTSTVPEMNVEERRAAVTQVHWFVTVESSHRVSLTLQDITSSV